MLWWIIIIIIIIIYVNKPFIYLSICNFPLAGDTFWQFCFVFMNVFCLGSKTFVDGFSANAGLNVTGLIAGIDLMALYMNSLLESREAHLRGQRVNNLLTS